MSESIDAANRGFKGTGLQFYLKANIGAVMPVSLQLNSQPFCGPGDSVCQNPARPWSGNPLTNPIGPELSALWGIPLTTYMPTEYNTIFDWLELTTFRHAPADEVTVFLSPYTGGGNSAGPLARKTIQMNTSALGTGQGSLLAHELGHYFGLGHVSGAWGNTDARANGYAPSIEMWDLIYLPGCNSAQCPPSGQAHRFFTSKADAAPFASAVNPLGQGIQEIEKCTDGACSQSCSFNSVGQVSCVVGVDASYTETIPWNSWKIYKRLSFSSSDVSSPPTSYAYGGNLMSYTSNSLDGPHSLAETQVSLVRNVLRYDTSFTYPGTAYTVRGGRVFLGDAAPLAPLYQLDMDGDGKREIVLWNPPTQLGNGRFLVLFSSTATPYDTASALTLDMGADTNAAVPVAGDINGDGRTDLGLYIPGTAAANSSVWRFCPTSATPLTTTCPTPTTINLGSTASIPAGVHRMGPSLSEAAVVFDRSGIWRWRPVGGLVASTTVTGSGVTDWSGSSPLVGKYDSDEYADLVLFRPQNARFYGMKSTTGWSYTQSYAYLNYFTPGGTGSAAARSGAVPVKNMYWRQGSSTPKLAMALWQPELGLWSVSNDPFGSTKQLDCYYGVPGDLPIGGLNLAPITGTEYRFSDLGIYRNGGLATAPLTPGLGYVFREPVASVPSNYAGVLPCPGTHSYSNLGATPSRWPVFTVGDMTGDGLADVIRVDPDFNLIWLYASPSYSLSRVIQLGTSRSEFL